MSRYIALSGLAKWFCLEQWAYLRPLLVYVVPLGLRNAKKITLPSWLLLLHLFSALKLVVYPDKRPLSRRKLSTK